MIKKTFSLSAALLFTLLFSVTCFAADSPTGTVIPTTQAPTTVAPTTKATEKTTKKSNKKNNKKNQNSNKNDNGGSDNNNSENNRNGSGSGSNSNNYIGRNTSQTSPKTGYALTGAFIAIISSAGVALISKKKMEAEE